MGEKTINNKNPRCLPCCCSQVFSWPNTPQWDDTPLNGNAEAMAIYHQISQSSASNPSSQLVKHRIKWPVCCVLVDSDKTETQKTEKSLWEDFSQKMMTKYSKYAFDIIIFDLIRESLCIVWIVLKWNFVHFHALILVDVWLEGGRENLKFEH